MNKKLRVALLTREYPPLVYGGGGVHVEHLARELRLLLDVTVHAWGDDRPGAIGHRPWGGLDGDAPHLAALRTLSVDLSMAAAVESADVVHSHTWYANLAGHLAKLMYGVPHVATAHSLEPLRPWKAEQLGGGYAVSRWCEQVALEHADAVIAVSHAMRRDVLACYPGIAPERVHVIHNGIDVAAYRPDHGTDALARHGIDPQRPSVAFVGRLSRQKGLAYLLDAAPLLEHNAQLVICTGAPETPELAAELAGRVRRLADDGVGVTWIDGMLPRRDIVQLLTHATVFVCPSVYEPQGIVNLEAMACETAVVASAVGGIPEVVDDGVTGLLVPFEPADLAAGIAARVNALLADPETARAMGRAGRDRATRSFGWPGIAKQTAELYERLAATR